MTPEQDISEARSPRAASSYLFAAASGLAILVVQTLIMLALDWQRLSAETMLFSVMNATLLTVFVSPILFYCCILPLSEEVSRLKKSLAEALRKNESKSAELTAAQASAEMRKRILERHALVSETDIEGRITSANAELCRVSGYTAEELIGETHRVLRSDRHPPEFWQDMRTTIARGAVWRGEICNKAKDGTLYWTRTTISAVTDADGTVTGYVSVGSDVTQTVRREQALKRVQAQLFETAARAKAECAEKATVLTTVSARMRTSLNGIAGTLELLRKTGLDREQAELIDIASQSSATLLRCMDEMGDEDREIDETRSDAASSGLLEKALFPPASEPRTAETGSDAIPRILDIHFDELKRRLDESLAAMWASGLADFKRVTHALIGAASITSRHDAYEPEWLSPRRAELSHTIFAHNAREPTPLLLTAGSTDAERSRMRLSQRLVEVERVLEPFGSVQPFDA